jgi:hypothetical protein
MMPQHAFPPTPDALLHQAQIGWLLAEIEQPDLHLHKQQNVARFSELDRAGNVITGSIAS